MSVNPNATINIIRGTNKTIAVTVKDVTGVAIDITGSTAYCSVKGNLEDAATLFQLSTAVGAEGSIVDAVAGKLEFYLVPLNTSALAPKSYWYDIQIVLADTKRYCVVPPNYLSVEWDVG